MGVLEGWRSSGLRRRCMSEAAVLVEVAEGRAPDATVDEVGVPGVNPGFEGPIGSRSGNGYGTGNPSSPGWAGGGRRASLAH